MQVNAADKKASGQNFEAYSFKHVHRLKNGAGITLEEKWMKHTVNQSERNWMISIEFSPWTAIVNVRE